MNKNSRILFTLCFIFILKISYAGEGMWLPQLLKALNEGDMQTMGMKMSAEDIYSVNNSSLKDAVVHFGGGCTGEMISDKGLLLTNHHCGYGQIQYHSTVENDFLTNGFWAMSQDEELANPGLTATFIVRMEDVTELIFAETADLEGEELSNKIKENIEKVGGRGIFLMKHLSDEVKFEEGGKKTILSFYLE